MERISFSDESSYLDGRYRSISVVSIYKNEKEVINSSFRQVLVDSEVKEFKWNFLGSARNRFAAINLIDKTLEFLFQKKIRVDTIIWDTEDSRHDVKRRDDIANLQRMYFHLFSFVMGKNRDYCNWELRPDENSALDWRSLGECLRAISYSTQVTAIKPQDNQFALSLHRDFWIQEIVEVSSKSEPVCQVADLFAGMSAFSYNKFFEYEAWVSSKSEQLSLPFVSVPRLPTFSQRDKERFIVIEDFYGKCKRRRLGISLKSNHGLRTFSPESIMNFWLYEPQHKNDKAPTI